MSRLQTLLLSLCLGLSAIVHADSGQELIRPIQGRWAEIKYQSPKKQQADLYHQLAAQAHQISQVNPNRPEALIWEAIVVSSEAGAKGGLAGLSLAKQAKALLEESLKLNEEALDGSAYTSLATLYAQVPGWPLGFGSKEKAEALFQKSLAVNPDGIDPNFFYGEYLIKQGHVKQGREHLTRALAAPVRPGRELADLGRRQEIQASLDNAAQEGR